MTILGPNGKVPRPPGIYKDEDGRMLIEWPDGNPQPIMLDPQVVAGLIDTINALQADSTMFAAQVQMLGQALGEVLVTAGAVVDTEMTGPELVVAARMFVESYDA